MEKSMRNILTIDQGTTSTRAILFSEYGETLADAKKELQQSYRKPGWVEQDANEIWFSVLHAVSELLAKEEVDPKSITAIGITNQRETAILWDRKTGLPVCPAIVWQSRQTAPFCDHLKNLGVENFIHERTGLPIDPYFSATKFAWMLDHTKDGRERAKQGELLCGTVDSWLIWKLTGGAVHATDPSNASRTQLYSLHSGAWDPELTELFTVPKDLLPEIRPSDGHFGNTAKSVFFDLEIPIRGVLGDQQAALFGQRCTAPGDAKNTYGTGCFLLMQTGETPVFSSKGLLTTVAWQMGDETRYALEGSVFVAGSAVQWLRDGLGIIEEAKESETLARTVPDAGGLVFVPAFVGLGAPYWDDRTRGSAFGLTRGTTAAHFARATLDAISYQTADVLVAMENCSEIELKSLKVDGGASQNDLLMQIQADILGIDVTRVSDVEATAKGVAMMAGFATGLWEETQIARHTQSPRIFTPEINVAERAARIKEWHRAIKATRVF